MILPKHKHVFNGHNISYLQTTKNRLEYAPTGPINSDF